MTANDAIIPKVLVLGGGDLLEIDLAALTPIYELATVIVADDEETLRREIKDADVLLVWDFRFSNLDEILPSAERLKWIHAASVGVEALLTPNLTEQGITLTNSRGVFDQAIAEYVLALYLSHLKGLRLTHELQNSRTWSHRLTQKLAGKRALVVGTGSIGREIARTLKKLELEVTLVGRRELPLDAEFGTIAQTKDLVELVKDCDLLALAAPLTNESRHMVDLAVLQAMSPTAYLVNVGRGPLIDESALAHVLASGGIGGAGLDVFDSEPLPDDSPFWSSSNVTVSPHMSADFEGFDEALVEVFLRNLRSWKAGAALSGVVDPELGYVPSNS